MEDRLKIAAMIMAADTGLDGSAEEAARAALQSADVLLAEHAKSTKKLDPVVDTGQGRPLPPWAEPGVYFLKAQMHSKILGVDRPRGVLVARAAWRQDGAASVWTVAELIGAWPCDEHGEPIVATTTPDPDLMPKGVPMGSAPAEDCPYGAGTIGGACGKPCEPGVEPGTIYCTEHGKMRV